MKEKKIEQAIVNYLLSIGAWCEALQSWKIMIKKWQYTNRMTLCSPWTFDVVCFYKNVFYWIEVKKNETESNKWLKLEARYKAWEILPKSYLREKNQIEHKHKILENWWVHILTHDLQEVIDYFKGL